MAAQAVSSHKEGALMALIVDEDTATGLLLTGVGHVDLRRKSNFIIVDDSEFPSYRRTMHTTTPTAGSER
jgi:vacuolar-type H+-ATPase subunit F/Vma7